MQELDHCAVLPPSLVCDSWWGKPKEVLDDDTGLSYMSARDNVTTDMYSKHSPLKLSNVCVQTGYKYST